MGILVDAATVAEKLGQAKSQLQARRKSGLSSAMQQDHLGVAYGLT